jgi:midasin (ATPase involved in ribosome maturation)
MYAANTLNSLKHLMMTRWRRYDDEASQQIHSRISTTKRRTGMESKCWMCDTELDEDEVQYCTHCELRMTAEILQETEAEELG